MRAMMIAKMKVAAVTLAAGIGTGILVAQAEVAVRYVAKGGSDSNPGTEAKPWLTVQKAADSLVAGETVRVREGTYKERVIPRNSGSAGKYITYAAYPGHTVTLDGTGLTFKWAGLFHMRDKRYVKVSGLRIVNSAYFGICVHGGSDHIIIENNYLHECQASGIHVWNKALTITNITIDGNEISETNMNGSQEGISVCGVDTFEIRNNHVHHIYKEGIDAKDGSSNGKIYGNHVHDLGRLGIYVDSFRGDGHDIDVYRNVVHDCGSGICLATESGGTLENIRVYNNIAYNNRYNGFAIHGYAKRRPGSHSKKNIAVTNNTFHNNSTLAVQITDAREHFENFVIRNNIFSGGGGMINFKYLRETDVTMDHNLFDATSPIRGRDPVRGNPGFVDPSLGDFHLKRHSPAVDKGSSIDAPSEDFDGNPRPWGAAYDIGAFEYGSRRSTRSRDSDSPNGFRKKRAVPHRPAGPTPEQRAAATEAEASLRREIIEGVKAGQRAEVYVDLAGKAVRGRIVSANDERFVVASSGMQGPYPWSSLSARRFYAIAKKYSEDHAALAAYRKGNRLDETRNAGR